MSIDADPNQLAGALLVVGFDGTELPRTLMSALHEGRRAGVIFFRRNLPDLDTTGRLAHAVRRMIPDGEPAPLVAIDQEGGRVTRLPAPARALPAMRVLARAGGPALAERAACAVALDLRRLGINLDFAPVLDVDSNPANPVIGDRAFSAEPALVAAHGLAFARGLNAGGVLACGKHFPGHGDTDTDSHLALPILRHDRARLDAMELAPFREAARAAIDSLMSAHVVVTAIDPDVPATLSKRVCEDLLRRDLGYGGVLFSDDLEMKAVADARDVADNAVMAISAGCDALLVCKSEELADRAHAALVREIEASAAFRARCVEAASRVAALRWRAVELAQLPVPPSSDPLWDAVQRALDGAGA